MKDRHLFFVCITESCFCSCFTFLYFFYLAIYTYRWIEALLDEHSGLTAKALRGVDPQSVPDAERMFGKGVIDFLESKGYTTDAK